MGVHKSSDYKLTAVQYYLDMEDPSLKKCLFNFQMFKI